MKLICLLLVALVPATLVDGYGRGQRAKVGRFYRGAYEDATGADVSSYDYNLRGGLSAHGDSVYDGTSVEHDQEAEAGYYTQGGSFFTHGKAEDNTDHGLDSYLKAKGKFYGTGYEDESSEYQTVTKFRSGGAQNGYSKKKHYNQYESYGQAKKTGDKKLKSNFDLYGKLKAQGKFNGYGKSDIFSKFDKYAEYGQEGKTKGTADKDVYGKLKGRSKYDAYGKLSGYGSGNDYSKYGSHGDYDKLGNLGEYYGY
ncbi:trematode Eggshell Synthesis [Opisthorchis viverrini]|uniref:Trematode Eggshell Synthesis n=1 Tax=Opisthorchis viverrini TaxID=6198 RepID=A0A1S8WKP3_OPIVI|nr:trematode Eggshell Synthesis [Opisthorchis viverrini]